MERIQLLSEDETMAQCDARRASAPRSRWVAMILSAAMAVIACGASLAATMQKTAITIRNFAFEPATLTVSAGSKVVWINRDDEPHLVASAGGQFPASPALDTDDSYAAVFAKPGAYTYFCSIHPHMVGKIIVK